MTEPNAAQAETPCAFRAPGTTEWRPLAAADAGQREEVQTNKNDLNSMLLASLQMQHVVVLAGSGCSQAAGGPSMLDLWNSTVGENPGAISIAATIHHDLADKNIEALLSKVEAFLHVNQGDKDAFTFLNASKKAILEKCSGFLQAGRLVSHKTFLHRLSRRRARDQRLKVFTPNYDLCFERAAGELGGVALDGFSFSVPRHYDPNFFTYDIIRRPRGSDDLGSYLEGVFLLYKLHGSVNWARSKDGAIYEKVNPTPEEACLIYPAAGKYQQSFTQPHLESMAQYLAGVREPNTCVLAVGFGFNDDHLAQPLLAAAKSNPHLRVIIADPKARSNVNSGNAHWNAFFELGTGGEDIWFIAADFQAFAQMIPDLKSLSPADKLLKAIQSAAKQ